ncbi:MAG: peroxidase family protein [Hyphomicrobium sp.]|nr:peroxidase family protein [Hyphomicrobium sp.]
MAYQKKKFPFTYLDLAFFNKQIDFRPLFDANAAPIVNWNGTGAIYDQNGTQLWDGVGLTPAEAITEFGISFPTYTSSVGLRNVDGYANNLFDTAWGTTDQPFMQRTAVVFDNYVKPLAASDPNAYYALKFATSPDPAQADFTKIGDNLATPGVNEAQTIQNVIDYTPRMISRTVTTAGVTFETVPGTTHLAKDVNGYTAVADYGMLQSFGQQNPQPTINGDIGPGGFVADTDPLTNTSTEWFIGSTNPGVAPVNGWFVLFGQFFDHGLDFVGKGADGTKITIHLAPDDPMYGVIDPTSGRPATQIVISRANVSGFTADGTPQWVNHTSPYIDQSQTYGSHQQLTSVLREWTFDPLSGTYRPGAEMLDGNTSAEWTNAFGELTTATLPTLNELRAHLIATGRDDLTWEDVLDLRNRDVSGDVIADGQPGAGHSGAALLLDMNPRFDNLRFENPLNPDAGAEFLANISTLSDAALALGCAFSYDGTTIVLDVPAGVAGPGTPAMTLTGASALYFWVNFADFSVKTTMAMGPTIVPVDPLVREAVGELLLASVGDHYIAGDGRVNENIGLTAVHHVFHEEHNFQVENIQRSVTALDIREAVLDQSETYDHALLHEWQIDTGTTDANGNFIYGDGSIAWNVDMLFDAAKMTVEMEYQHTAVDQFARTITPNLHEFVGYNSGENATISLDFAQVAYRFGHSTLRESIDLIDPNGSITDAVMRVALERAFLSPEKFAAVGAGALALGMTHQQANEIDEFLTPALNQGLLGQPLDLAAINIARGRDLGVPTLNDMREALQLTRYTSWADFAANMIHPDNLVNFIAAYAFDGNVARAEAILGLANDAIVEGTPEAMGYTVQQAVDFLNNTDSSLYGCDAFNQIDCWLGGLAEVHVTGGLLGETFDTIFVDQIGRVMDGDRLYYLQRLSNVPYGQQIIDEQFKDLIERTTGAEHLNGSAFAYADQYYDLAGQEVANARTEHKYGDALDANPTLGIFTDGGTTTGLNGSVVRINGVDYIRDLRTPSLETRNGDPAGFALDGAPNSGAESHEVLVATDRNDLVYMRGGDDTAYGEGGNDIIYGGNGIDRLYGGAGDDRIYGGDGGDLIDGGEGDDVLFGEQSATAAAGIDQVIGSAGNDYVDGGIGIDKLAGSEGDDVIFGGGDTDAFTHAGEGNDYVDGGVTGDLLWGDNGDDLIAGRADQDIVAGMEGDDILRPGPVSQSLTNGGDEVLGGDGVNDAGNDGKGRGFDLLDLSDWQAAPVGATFDLINQANPLPAIDGAPQFPAVTQIEGVIGTQNDDTFVGDANDNWLIGGSGNDLLTGSVGDDLIVGDGIRLDELVGTYASDYDLYFDGASHRAFGYVDAAESAGLERNFIQSNGILDMVGWSDQKHFTEMLKSAMFKDLELGGSEVKALWRNGVVQTTGESAGFMGDGGTAGSLDIAAFTGNIADYTFDLTYFDLVTRTIVADQTPTSIAVAKVTDGTNGRDGVDVLVGVEQLKFADGVVTLTKPAVDLHAFDIGNYRDQFGAIAYNNSNGSAPWTSSWLETGDRAGVPELAGEIRVFNDRLEFRRDTAPGATAPGATLTRTVDLSAATHGTATLSFNYAETNLDPGESVLVQFAGDGLNFTTLQTLNGASNNGIANLTLTGPFSANSAVRFVFSGLDAGNEAVRIDNFDVKFVVPIDDGTRNWTTTFTENGAAVGVSSFAAISGGVTLASAKVVLTNAMAGDTLTTAGALPPGITVTTTVGSGTVTLDFTGSASVADYQAAIDAIRFANASDTPDTTARHIEVTVNNGLVDSDPAISTINVVAFDDPMVANNDRVVTNYAAGTLWSIAIADLLANDTDPDSAPAIASINSQNGLGGLPTLDTIGGVVTLTDSGQPGGSFVYIGTGTPADAANVTVVRDDFGALEGSANSEIIIGDASGTVIVGNRGRDVIYGGDGADTFDYNSTADTPVTPTDTITSANVADLEVIRDFLIGQDHIDLSTIDAMSGPGNNGNQAFVWLDQADWTSANANGALHYEHVLDSQGNWMTIVEASTDADAAAEFQIALLGQYTLGASDFIL